MGSRIENERAQSDWLAASFSECSLATMLDVGRLPFDEVQSLHLGDGRHWFDRRT